MLALPLVFAAARGLGLGSAPPAAAARAAVVATVAAGDVATAAGDVAHGVVATAADAAAADAAAADAAAAAPWAPAALLRSVDRGAAAAAVDFWIAEKEASFGAFESYAFASFILEGSWALAYASDWAHDDDVLAFDSIEQSFHSNNNSFVNRIQWRLVGTGESGSLEARASFEAGSRGFMTKLEQHLLRPTNKLQTEPQAVVAALAAALPKAIFLPDGVEQITYVDAELRIARVGQRRLVFQRIHAEATY